MARFAGNRDTGLDVVGFISNDTFTGGWDNYQCKHYDHPLRPSDVTVEIAKIIYYSYRGEYTPPRKCYFVAPRGIGTTLEKLLANPTRLKSEVRDNWSTRCEKEISSTEVISLSGGLAAYFEQFAFAIFSAKSLVELILGHSKTPFHTVRFGGGLPARPAAMVPPSEIERSESRYIQQLIGAYEDHAGVQFSDVASLSTSPDLHKDLRRQRERFYHAESLRNFARDTVPEGTFGALQEEVYQGVVDTCAEKHNDGLARMRAVVSQAARLPLGSNPLVTVMRTQDKQGICHQLANVDRLSWCANDEHQ